MDWTLLRKAGISIALLWACWWSFFAFASSTQSPGRIMNMVIPVVFSMVLFGSALLAWKWPALGGIVLILEGALVCLAYPIGFLNARQTGSMIFVLLALAMPALISGMLFIWVWRKNQ